MAYAVLLHTPLCKMLYLSLIAGTKETTRGSCSVAPPPQRPVSTLGHQSCSSPSHCQGEFSHYSALRPVACILLHSACPGLSLSKEAQRQKAFAFAYTMRIERDCLQHSQAGAHSHKWWQGALFAGKT